MRKQTYFDMNGRRARLSTVAYRGYVEVSMTFEVPGAASAASVLLDADDLRRMIENLTELEKGL